MLDRADDDRRGSDVLVSSGWSFTESEEAAFSESERRRKTISHILEHRIGYVSPQGISIQSGCQIVHQGLKHLASRSAKRPDTSLLEPHMVAVLSRLGEMHCADEMDAEDRTVYFEMEERDFLSGCANQIPDLIQNEQPGLKFCMYRMQYCFDSSDEEPPVVFLKIEFSEEVMAYTAAVTLAHWSMKANFKIDLACSALNKARCLPTLVCRLDGLFSLEAGSSHESKILVQASRGRLAQVEQIFKLEHSSGLSFDTEKDDDENGIIVRFLDAEQAAKFLLSIPEADIDGVRPLKYHIPAFQPKWCWRCHRFGHEDNQPDAICDLSPSSSGCGAFAMSGANLPLDCGGPHAADLRTCWTYVLKEALYEGQRMSIEAIDCHALLPLNMVIQRHEDWTRETHQNFSSKSESDIEKVFRTCGDFQQNKRRYSDVGYPSVSPQACEGSPFQSSEMRGTSLDWGYSWFDLSLSFWEQTNKKED